MKRLEKLGIVALGAVALTALGGTGSASAEKSGSFTATGGAGHKLETSVVSQHVLTLTGSELKCNKVTFTGATEGVETTSQTVTPSFSECTAFGLPTTITNSNCVIRLTATTDKEGGHAEAHLEKGPGAGECSITTLAKNIFGECHTELTPQTIKGIHYVNNASPEGSTWQFTATSLVDHVTKSTGVCPLSVGTHSNGSWTAEVAITAAGGLQYMETASAGAP